MAAAHFELSDTMVFLAAAGVVLPLMHRFRVSPVLGFLVVGLLLGPSGLGAIADRVPGLAVLLVSDPERFDVLGELGLVFLLFMIGLELSVDRLWTMRHYVFGLGGAQVVVTGSAIAIGLWTTGTPANAAVVAGAALALSSTAIVMQLLGESKRIGSPVGRTSFAVLLFQDLAVVPILLLAQLLAHADDAGIGASLFLALIKAAAVIGALLLIGRLAIRPLFRMVVATGIRELFLAAVLFAVIGTALATQAAGLSLALGAFLAGLLVSETEFRHQIAVDLDPFKGLLLGVFFVSVGYGMDLGVLAHNPLGIVGAALALIAIKAGILYGLCRLAHIPVPEAVETGLLLSQGSEFVFVVAGLAGGLDLFPGGVQQFLVVVVGLTMLATPAIAAIARRLGKRLQARRDRHLFLPQELRSRQVIIIGFGRVGRIVAEALDHQAISYTAIDNDPAVIAELRARGVEAHWGNAAHADFLARIGAERASALVVTMNDADAATQVVTTARKDWPSLPIYARAHDSGHAGLMMRLGAQKVVLLPLEASLQLSEAILTGLGVPDDAAHGIVNAARDAHLATLTAARTKPV